MRVAADTVRAVVRRNDGGYHPPCCCFRARGAAALVPDHFLCYRSHGREVVLNRARLDCPCTQFFRFFEVVVAAVRRRHNRPLFFGRTI
jgi:hypothetical protein